MRHETGIERDDGRTLVQVTIVHDPCTMGRCTAVQGRLINESMRKGRGRETDSWCSARRRMNEGGSSAPCGKPDTVTDG
jgi:hypothetical protein